ncbi:MAG: hypothetical protein D6731_19145 [Planctomycetota bacterium]|nr:MAG: hypothetical protein D6731_19145 [Planctomycetota bacterium]
MSEASGPRALPVVTAVEASVPPLAGAVGTEEELRTSNGVDGFRYSRLKMYLWILKLALGIPLLPLWPFLIAHEARDWSLARNYFGTMGYVLRTCYVHLRFGSVLRMLKYNVLLGPERVKERIAQRRGACTRCAKCCRQYDCIFLGQDPETKEHYCKVYQTNYWYYGTCGRYPLDQADIDAHACPGFSFRDESAAR